jgi:hypothetical protein
LKTALVALVVGLVLASTAGAATTVELDRAGVSTRIGEHFTFTSAIRNDSAQTQNDLVAHLNVLSSDPGTYVDPEDWSSHRTRYLTSLAPHEVRKVTWTVTAVNSGSIAIYVALLPRHGTGQVVVSSPLRVEIAKRRTLNSGGVLPLVLGIPALLGLTAFGMRARRPKS